MAVTQFGGNVQSGDVLRFSCVTWTADQLGIFDMHYQCGAIVGAGARAGKVAQAILTALEITLPPLLSVQTRLLGARMDFVRLTPLPLGGIADSAAIGTDPGQTLPQQVSGILTKVTTLAGRANRGRCYIPFPTTTYLDTDDSPNVPYVLGLDALGADLVAVRTVTDGADSSTVGAVLYHRASNTTTAVASWLSRKRWATQHRRGNYGRTNAPLLS